METNARSLVKALSYRVVGSISTGAIAYVFTGSTKASLGVGTADFFVKIALYFLHERLWNYIPFGRPAVKAPEYEI